MICCVGIQHGHQSSRGSAGLSTGSRWFFCGDPVTPFLLKTKVGETWSVQAGGLLVLAQGTAASQDANCKTDRNSRHEN